MDSRFHGVPISATQTAPMAAPSFKGIRAPLTVDDTDFEYSVSPRSRRNSTTSSYYSESELESEGFASGEDESASVSEGVHVVEKDEAVLEGTHFVEEFAFSEPSVRSPDENLGKESDYVSGNAVLRPFVGGNFDDSDGSRSFLSESGDEVVDDESYVARYGYSKPLVAAKDEDVVVSGPSPMVDVGIPLVQKLHIPIAQISADSDDDSQGSGVLDEEGFSGIVRVPSIEILHRINSAPKVRISEFDEGDETKLQGKIIDLVEDLVISNAVLGPSDEEHFDLKNSVHPDLSGDMIQDKGSDIDKETTTDLLVGNEVSDSMHLDEDIQEIDVNDEQKKCVELVDHREPTHFAEDIIFPENISDSEKMESENEHEIVQTIESFSSNPAQEISSTHRCADIKKVPEFPESLTESVQVYMSDSLFKDASLTGVIDAGESVFEGSVSDQETRKEVGNSDRLPGEVEDSSFRSDIKAMVAEMNRVPDSTCSSNVGILLDHSEEIDGHIVTDFHEVNADGGISDHRHVIDPAIVAACFEAVRGSVSDGGGVKLAPIDGIDNLSLESNSARPIIAERNSDKFVHPSTNGESEEGLSGREKKKIEKIKQIRVKYLRLLHRLGCSPEDSVASKVLYQLGLAEGSSSSQNLNSKAAMELEVQRDKDLDFSLSILVIGKTGVGKSATINSIFGERKAVVDAFETTTTRVEEIVGSIYGVKLKVFDTPGLRTSLIDQSINGKILSSIKKFIKKSPPDIILYIDRLDTQTSLDDLPLLKSVTSYLGSLMWRKSVIALTHGTSIPPDGPNGCPLSYEVFVAQQLQVIQQLISRSVVMNSGSIVPICLVENHPFAKRNGQGETLLPNGESWRSQLLLLCYSMKTLSELSSTVQNHSDHRNHPPALSCLLSSFLQSNAHPDENLGKSRSGEGHEASTEEVTDQEMKASETATVSLQDIAFPPSFDGGSPSFRYCISEPSSRLLMRPVLDSHGWDHDCGYDVPAVILSQLTKDKKEFTIQLHSSTMAGLDILTLKGETRIKNKTAARLSTTFHDENVVSGLKLEDHFAVAKQLILVGNAGVVLSHDDAANGEDQTSLGLSVMRHRGDLICGCNLHSRFSVGRNSKLNVTAALNSKFCGKISIKASCSDQLQIAALALVPIARAIFKNRFRQSTQD